MLYAVGLKQEDMNKPQVRNINYFLHQWIIVQIGVASIWYEGNPCNMHLLDLSADVKQGVEDAGLIGFRFNAVGVSDAISMGTTGMNYSLQSRDLIADSIETVVGAQWYDGVITIPGICAHPSGEE